MDQITAQPPLRIMLVGPHGQLGHELAKVLPSLGTLSVLDRTQCDLTDCASLPKLLKHGQPDVIVNAAAYTAVDLAQTNTDLAHRINATAPLVLAEQAAALGAVLVHYSTDYVFDGLLHRAYLETDPANPLSVYGQSKWAGEKAIQQVASRHLIFRTSWVVGAHGGNFLKTMLRLGLERDSLRVVADQIGAPTPAAWLAQATVHALQSLQTQAAPAKNLSHGALGGPSGQWAALADDRWGLYHLAADGHTSWHGYAQHIMQRANELGWPLKTTPDRVQAIATSDYPLPAPRPANSCLNTDKWLRAFARPTPHWQSGVDQVLNELNAVRTLA